VLGLVPPENYSILFSRLVGGGVRVLALKPPIFSSQLCLVEHCGLAPPLVKTKSQHLTPSLPATNAAKVDRPKVHLIFREEFD
jgi:hypothetical protein